MEANLKPFHDILLFELIYVSPNMFHKIGRVDLLTCKIFSTLSICFLNESYSNLTYLCISDHITFHIILTGFTSVSLTFLSPLSMFTLIPADWSILLATGACLNYHLNGVDVAEKCVHWQD